MEYNEGIGKLYLYAATLPGFVPVPVPSSATATAGYVDIPFGAVVGPLAGNWDPTYPERIPLPQFGGNFIIVTETGFVSPVTAGTYSSKIVDDTGFEVGSMFTPGCIIDRAFQLPSLVTVGSVPSNRGGKYIKLQAWQNSGITQNLASDGLQSPQVMMFQIGAI